MFLAGATVVIVGVESQPDLNGRWCVVERFDKRTGRFKVRVAGKERLVGLKPANVSIPAEYDNRRKASDAAVDPTPSPPLPLAKATASGAAAAAAATGAPSVQEVDISSFLHEANRSGADGDGGGGHDDGDRHV